MLILRKNFRLFLIVTFILLHLQKKTKVNGYGDERIYVAIRTKSKEIDRTYI